MFECLLTLWCCLSHIKIQRTLEVTYDQFKGSESVNHNFRCMENCKLVACHSKTILISCSKQTSAGFKEAKPRVFVTTNLHLRSKAAMYQAVCVTTLHCVVKNI